MPKRFGLEYTAKDGSKQTPVMLHRAIAGSLERFLSMAIPHFGGEFPLWMHPVQVSLIPISENHIELARTLNTALDTAGFRTDIDTSDQGLGKKIRAVKVAKNPYYIVIGDKELETNTFGFESRDGNKTEGMTIDSIIEKLQAELL